MNNPPKVRSILLIIIGLALAFLSVAHAPRSLASVERAQASTPTAMQVDVPAEAVDIGSTDGITIWGTILVIIVLAAVVWHRPDWSNQKRNLPKS